LRGRECKKGKGGERGRKEEKGRERRKHPGKNFWLQP